jgi:hypothetical protein
VAEHAVPPPTVVDVVEGTGVELDVVVEDGRGADVELVLVLLVDVVGPGSVVVEARLVLVTVVDGVVVVELLDPPVLVEVVELTMVDVVVDPSGPDTLHVTPVTFWKSPSEASMTMHLYALTGGTGWP